MANTKRNLKKALVSETPTARFVIERRRFEKVCGNNQILRIGWRIASRSWYSWKECRASMRKLPKDHTKAARQYLRAAQQERHLFDRATWEFDQSLARRFDPFRCFVVQMTPSVYLTGARPLMLGSARIGYTLKFERIPGNLCRVYYASDVTFALDCVKIENQWLEKDLWKSMGEEPMLQTIYHMKIRKSVATAPRREMVNSGG